MIYSISIMYHRLIMHGIIAETYWLSLDAFWAFGMNTIVQCIYCVTVSIVSLRLGGV
jgi:hypothetical protein